MIIFLKKRYKDFRIGSISVSDPKWRLVSLYRLHFGEVKIEDGGDSNSYAIIRSVLFSVYFDEERMGVSALRRA